MKKIITFSLALVLLFATFFPTVTVLASETKKDTISEEKDDKLLDKVSNFSDFEIVSVVDHTVTPDVAQGDMVTPYVIVNDGGFTWKKINTRNVSSKLSNSIVNNTANFVVDVILAYFGAKIIKAAVKVSEFVAAIASTSVARVPSLIKAPATIYYTITTYEDYDAINYYVKQNIKIYSNSSKTKLVSNSDVISKFRRN